MKNNILFANKLKDIALNYKTLYVLGCFGAPLTDVAKTRYKNAYAYNKQDKRRAKIDKATPDTFGFDCVCLIKGVLWGWNGDTNAIYGGAYYDPKEFPDTDADGIMKQCSDVSKDFSKIEVGELVHLKGHVGVYIGNEEVVECTPIWKDGVQITKLSQRKWVNHGKLKLISYLKSDNEVEETKDNTSNEKPISKDITDEELLNIVRRTIRGDFGNGLNRKNCLGKLFSIVQNQVNKNIKDKNYKWDKIHLYK